MMPMPAFAANRQPHRVQLRRAKGWRMPPDTVKVDRSTIWGNPFVVGRDGGDRAECVARFARLLAGDCVSQAEQLWARTWPAGAP